MNDLRKHYATIDGLLKGAIRFWKTTVDWERGGFFGKVDYEGRPIPDASKHMMQQVRHLWTFSTAHRFEEPSAEVAEICHHHFSFVRDRLFQANNAEFFLAVSPGGEPRAEGMNLYYLAFGIFGLSAYAMAFPETETGRQALEMAKSVFLTMKRRSFRRRTGFDERVYPSRWCKDDKEINTQMHLLEAITSLFQALRMAGDPMEPMVRRVLNKQLDLVAFKGIVRTDKAHFCSRGYRKNWRVVNDWEVDCGHDIETVHLTMAAARALGRDGEPRLTEAIVNLGRGSTLVGFDPAYGKWLYSADPRTGEPRERVANVWTNFEALNGLSTTFLLTGDEAYLEKFGRVLSWLAEKQRNQATGEWYYNVDDQGRPVDVDVFGEPCGWITFSWKSSYHPVRALVNCKAWIQEWRGRPDNATPQTTP